MKMETCISRRFKMRKLFICLTVAVAIFAAEIAVADRYEKLVEKIVESEDTNDDKVHKIELWVSENIQYVSDPELFAGKKQLWLLPRATLGRKKADCEDGAFLAHRLALAAGIPYDRVRTYFGEVRVKGDDIQGHAWVGYKRETDGKWVEVEWTGGKKRKRYPIKQRRPMSVSPVIHQIWGYIEITKVRPLRLKKVEFSHK